MHIEKYKSGQIGGLLLHDERSCDNHTNEQIDPSRSNLNYNFIQENSLQRYKQIMSDVVCLKRADVNTLVSIAITLPDNVPEERSEEFFQHCFDFLAERYGKQDNLVSAWVHNDETTPHMHFKFVPVYWNEKKQQRAVSFDKVMPRKEYQTIHQDLENHIKNQFGTEGLILNGATANGNKTILELKNETLLKENKELLNENIHLKNENHSYKKENKAIKSKLEAYHVATKDIKIYTAAAESKAATTKIPLLSEMVKKSDYDKVCHHNIKLINALQVVEAENKALQSENKSLKDSIHEDSKMSLQFENSRLRSDLEQVKQRLSWHEGFYQGIIKSFQELLPEAVRRILSFLPDQHKKKVMRDLHLELPQQRKERDLSR